MEFKKDIYIMQPIYLFYQFFSFNQTAGTESNWL